MIDGSCGERGQLALLTQGCRRNCVTIEGSDLPKDDEVSQDEAKLSSPYGLRSSLMQSRDYTLQALSIDSKQRCHQVDAVCGSLGHV